VVIQPCTVSVCGTSPLLAQCNATVVPLQSLCPLCVTYPLSAQHNTTVVQLHNHFAPSVSLPHCQHNTTPLLFSCTVTLPPLCHFPTVNTAQHHCCSAAQSQCPLCVTSPLSAQHNTTVVQLHSHFAPSVHKTVYSKVSVLLRPNSGTAAES
jgi:hypothetical protein